MFLLWLTSLLGLAAIYGVVPHPISFHLHPRTPVVQALKDFSFESYQTNNNTGTLVVHRAEWELRDAFRHRRVAVIPAQMYFYDGVLDKRPPHPEGERDSFDADDLRRIGPVEPGYYEMALLIDGKRASNVMALEVDPTFDPAKQPVLTVGMEEAPPDEKVGSVLVWVAGPNPFDPKFTNFDVAFGDITVDGVSHKSDGMAWTGPVGPYSIGDVDVRPFDTPYRLKGVDVFVPHEFSVQVGKYGSAVVKLNLSSHELARQWDAGTSTMAALAAPKYLLAGVVHDEQANPAAGCEVRIRRDNGPVQIELTNEKGEYGFSGIEPGAYSVTASPVGKGTPLCKLERVEVVADRTREVPLTFEGTYGFSGRVTDRQGRGLKGVLVEANWKEPESGTECETMATTKPDGSYELRGPFPSITDVGLLSQEARPRYDAKPGAKNVDFAIPAK
jgi:Carboxypeptidase regulatory-like domain